MPCPELDRIVKKIKHDLRLTEEQVTEDILNAIILAESNDFKYYIEERIA